LPAASLQARTRGFGDDEACTLLRVIGLLVVVIIGVLRRRSLLGCSWFRGPDTQR
jgi:hypothetical protein